jgi:Mn-dependent DtxR family transcriptional regulator
MGDRDRDEESGQYVEKYPRESFIQAIEAEGGQAGTTDIADHVGVIHETAYKKLNRMEEDGEIESRKFGRSLVWSVVEEDR